MQHLSPRQRWLGAIAFILFTALTPLGQFTTWGWYGLLVLLLILSNRLPLVAIAQRLGIELLFLSVLLLSTLWQPGGDTLWQWGPLQITAQGLQLLGSVAAKTTLSLAMLKVLTLTTPLPALLAGLRALHIPPLFIDILAAMVRYLSLLQQEFQTMQRAALSRNLLGRSPQHRLVVASLIGSLFIRSYDRGDRIHQAMLSRGYQGEMPAPVAPAEPLWSWIYLVGWCALLAIVRLAPNVPPI